MLKSKMHVDAAAITLASITLDLSDDVDPLITARYRVCPLASDERRPIQIDFSDCPLTPVSVESEGAKPIVFKGSGSGMIYKTLLHLQSSADSSWCEQDVVIKLKWSDDASHPSPINRHYLYCPNELPTVGSLKRSEAGVALQTPVNFQGAFDQLLAGAVAYSAGVHVEASGPYVRAVLARNDVIAFESVQDEAQVRLVGIPHAMLTVEYKSQIYSTIREMCAYVGERLQVHPIVRIGAELNAPAKSQSLPGPLLLQPLERFRRPSQPHAAPEFPTARDVANNWWGAGCRIDGPNAIYLNNGIAWAIGLAWAKAHVRPREFDLLLAYYQERMIRYSRLAKPAVRPGERSVGMGVVLYDALSTNSEAWNALRKLTAEYWACLVPEQVVLSSLDEVGVPVADLEQRRFHRG